MSILFDMVKPAASIAILGHIRPDGDCVGSCLGVYNYLKEQYPDKTIQVYLQKPPARFNYLPCFQDISQDISGTATYDLCICLDSGDKERLGEFGVYLETAKASLCIDHHITNTGYAQENQIHADASATCEIVYSYLEEAAISKAVAECLYTGIIHDTNVFKNSNTTMKTMTIAGTLMEKGISFGKIIDESFYRKTYIQNQIMGRAMLESMTFLHGACIFSAIRKSDMDFYGVDGSDLDGIVDQLRITDGVECAIFIYETDNHEYKVSMRSNCYVDVSRVASYFGGGGHVRAAGCTMHGSIHDVINNLSLKIEDQMKEQA